MINKMSKAFICLIFFFIYIVRINCLPKSCDSHAACGRNAQCIWSEAKNRYICECNNGYEGDGHLCVRVSSRQDDFLCENNNSCPFGASCVYDTEIMEKICKCNDGSDILTTYCHSDELCYSDKDCPSYAVCREAPLKRKMMCICKKNYTLVDNQCVEDQFVRCNTNCDSNAKCLYDPLKFRYYCKCNKGFRGDGKFCERYFVSCNLLNNCHFHAKCEYDQDEMGYRCKCNPGFKGDGITCSLSYQCNEDLHQCHKNATCVYLKSTRTYQCKCNDNFKGDGFHCEESTRHDGNYLIFAQGMSILKLPFNPTSLNRGQLLFTKNQIPVGIDVDCVNGYIYWTDVSMKAIHKLPYKASNFSTVISQNMGSPEGIAIDWVSRNIYWTDSVLNVIRVASLNGEMVKTLFDTDLEEPRGIAVHPGLGRIYWTDWNRNNPKIETASMDGSSRKILINTNIKLPNMITIDYFNNDLCWTDAGMKEIQCSDLFGRNVRTIIKVLDYPFDLAIFDRDIYWSDWKINKFIHKVSKYNGKVTPIELPLGGNGKIYGLVTVLERCPPMVNVCSQNNGGCRYLCLPNADNWRTCACPDNVEKNEC